MKNFPNGHFSVFQYDLRSQTRPYKGLLTASFSPRYVVNVIKRSLIKIRKKNSRLVEENLELACVVKEKMYQ